MTVVCVPLLDFSGRSSERHWGKNGGYSAGGGGRGEGEGEGWLFSNWVGTWVHNPFWDWTQVIFFFFWVGCFACTVMGKKPPLAGWLAKVPR